MTANDDDLRSTATRIANHVLDGLVDEVRTHGNEWADQELTAERNEALLELVYDEVVGQLTTTTTED